ncbi:hypothetical protein HGM15179_015754 [Zosterops borbonicus]|uniref:Uncharacterized protein n=1 Tax=Zosterops borbonicus TaxID=364589 RepID=A0A8K1LEY7_9PASS|nr:hypothetical protein HGM15179_015754 [Zosterops borbonicus]
MRKTEMQMEEKAIPKRWGNRGERGTATSSQSLAAALRRTTCHDTRTVHRSRIPVPVSRVLSAGIQRPRQQPRARQEQAHSMPGSASPGNGDQAVPLLGESEPPRVLKTSTRAGRRAPRETHVESRSRIPVPVSRVVSAGIQRPRQQPRAQPDQAHSMPGSAPLGGLPATWGQRQESEQDTQVSCVQMSPNLSGTSLPVPGKSGDYLSTMSQKQPVQELNTKHADNAEHRLPLLREASHQSVPDCVEANFLSQCGATGKEEKQAEENRPREPCQGKETNDKEMSQAEGLERPQELSQKEYCPDEELPQAAKDNEQKLLQGEGSKAKERFQVENDAIWDIYDLWDYFLGPCNEYDPHAEPHQLPSSLSSLDSAEAAAEAVPDLQSTSPATAGATGAEAAGQLPAGVAPLVQLQFGHNTCWSACFFPESVV